MAVDLNIIKLTELKNDMGLVGYDTKEIEVKLGADLYASFTKWFAGKTGIIINGKFCVYPHDWELWVYLRLRAINKKI